MAIVRRKPLSRRVVAALAAVTGLACSAGPAAATVVVDGSFETQGAASMGTGGYCYLGAGSTCAAGAWTSANGGGGIIGVDKRRLARHSR